MSNATTLQTNNNKLSANNTDLASILNTINNLPEAGGGGSGGGGIQTVTIDILDLGLSGYVYNLLKIFYTTYENGEIIPKVENLELVVNKEVIVGSVVGLIDTSNSLDLYCTSYENSNWEEQSHGTKIENTVYIPIYEDTGSIDYVA